LPMWWPPIHSTVRRTPVFPRVLVGIPFFCLGLLMPLPPAGPIDRNGLLPRRVAGVSEPYSTASSLEFCHRPWMLQKLEARMVPDFSVLKLRVASCRV
jgi:hypothetical protein